MALARRNPARAAEALASVRESPSGRSFWARSGAAWSWHFSPATFPLQKRRSVIVSEAQEQEHALPRVEVIEVDRVAGKQRTGAARQYPGHHRSPHSGARRRLHPAPHGGHRRSRSKRPAARRDRSARDGRAGPPGQGDAAAGAGGTRPGARQSGAGQGGYRSSRASPPNAGADLSAQGVVSHQDNDQYQTQYQSRVAGVQALEKAIAVRAQQRRRRRSQPGAARQRCRATAW